ncbi:MAG TPA: hypothetical protein PKH37_02605 [Alphaproteobacteria bacterium]|nr:hypothetical protein [Alphaproteobacteria bacterium]
MDNLEKVLEDFGKTGNVQNVIDSGLSLDPLVLQTHIQSLPADRQDQFRTVLKDLLDALTIYIEDNVKERDEIKKQIDGTLKSTQACLSYGSAQGLTPRKDNADE